MTGDANRYRSISATADDVTAADVAVSRQSVAHAGTHPLTLGGSGRSHRREGLPGSRWRVFRPAVDAVVAFAAFAILTGALSIGPSVASPSITKTALSVPASKGSAVAAFATHDRAPVVQIATITATNRSNAVYRQPSDPTAFMLLAMSFSILAAFNLAFYRHLRHAYARPKRRERRQQPSPHHLSE